ncbi:MAG: asparagine synthase (glutamine-hydrolyzing) [Candidatus Melainabacteria bacterium]|nr:asparagine synthase (glutamine-hydrolyzing) [Candidatus Melainabacteria bacterium]
MVSFLNRSGPSAVCGISGFFTQTSQTPVPQRAEEALALMLARQRHRGPDDEGTWLHPQARVGLAHNRLSILDLSAEAAQPMVLSASDEADDASPLYVLTYNGEIYNYRELRAELGESRFRTRSDTEVILRAYETWGADCVKHFRGMFAFALWDARRQQLFIARDRFGIKPFYYTQQQGAFWFASEMKTLLPFLEDVALHRPGLRDYFTFQFCLNARTLVEGIHRLEPAHCGYVLPDGALNVWRYWEVQYQLDWEHTEKYFVEALQARLAESVALHLRSDVPVGAYISGGVDSSLVASWARQHTPTTNVFEGFTGKFPAEPGAPDGGSAFDESAYARAVAEANHIRLHEVAITPEDFIQHLPAVLYHLDEPVAGPGSFPQFMVSRLVREAGVKVVLGGQGGDEIFGGYARYLVAYFEQCLKAAIEGTMRHGNFIVTYESIIPNLQSLRQYKPMLQQFWSKGLFEERDRRYFSLIDRAPALTDVVNWAWLDQPSAFEDFQRIYWGQNVEKESYFDTMTHFDFKTLLPALLHVEDRMSMAHGVESRVPFLDHGVVELVATIPSNIKFKNGELKRLLRVAYPHTLPAVVRDRKDKMGFPVPLQPWMQQHAGVRQFVHDTFLSESARHRPYLQDSFQPEALMAKETPFGRNLWALLSLELWQQQLLDHHRPFALHPQATFACPAT